MDIEKLRKLSKKASEAGELVKAVTAFKNELKDKEQMYDVTMSEHFKTLREPLIEQQKKTDEKQDKVIEQLQKNQLALTSGIQDIMTLNKELPQLESGEIEGPKELPAPDEDILMANINKKFDDEEMEIFKKNSLMVPSKLLKLNFGELKDYLGTVEQLSRDYGYKFIGPKKTKETKTGITDPEIPGLEKEKKNNRLLWCNSKRCINFSEVLFNTQKRKRPQTTKKKRL